MKIDLTGLGYPADLGDKLIFTGIMFDGDSFEDPLANYGTRAGGLENMMVVLYLPGVF